jgi:electron transfer flavoprotein beta subunit
VLTTVVCMKITHDTSQLKPDPETREPRLENAPRRISTLDENALETAVRLKQKHGGRIIALSLVADEPPRDIPLKALAMGADEIVLIRDDTSSEADALATAGILAAALRKLGPWHLVLCGDGSIDQYNRQVGPRIAEELGLPPLTQVVALELRDGVVTVDRALEDRVDIVEAGLPAVVTVGQEINEPRLPTILPIMGSSRKPRTVWALSDLGFPGGTTAAGMAGVTTVRVTAPPSERRRVDVGGTNVEDIVRKLARVLLEEGMVKTR